MRLTLLLLATTVALGGCSDPVEKAEKRLAIVERHGSSRDVCAAKRELQDAYLNAGREEEYSNAKLSADVHCMNADFEGRYGPAQSTGG